jgi:hypothetical protein
MKCHKITKIATALWNG